MRGSVNSFNQMLHDRKLALRSAYRHPISPGCDLTDPKSTPLQRRQSLLHIPINITNAGDNELISTLVGTKLIYEMVIWNVNNQDLAFYQGPSATGILLLALPSLPTATGFTLGFSGSFEQPHFQIDSGQPFVLNIDGGTPVTGFLKYRIATEAF